MTRVKHLARHLQHNCLLVFVPQALAAFESFRNPSRRLEVLWCHLLPYEELRQEPNGVRPQLLVKAGLEGLA